LAINYGLYYAVSDDVDSLIAYKTLDFRYPLRTRKGMLCCKGRHILLLRCVITFLRYMRKVVGDSGSIYEHFIIHTLSFLLRLTLRLHTYYQIWDILFEHEVGWYAMSRDIHC